MEEDAVIGTAGGHIEVGRRIENLHRLVSRVLSIEAHHHGDGHHERFSPGNGDHDGVVLPAGAAEVRQGGYLEQIAVSFVNVQGPCIGNARRPGGQYLAAVAPGQDEVAFRHDQG